MALPFEWIWDQLSAEGLGLTERPLAPLDTDTPITRIALDTTGVKGIRAVVVAMGFDGQRREYRIPIAKHMADGHLSVADTPDPVMDWISIQGWSLGLITLFERNFELVNSGEQVRRREWTERLLRESAALTEAAQQNSYWDAFGEELDARGREITNVLENAGDSVKTVAKTGLWVVGGLVIGLGGMAIYRTARA